MASEPDTVREGFVDFEVKSISKVCQTYYKIIGDLKPGVRPFIALHGGPGVSSEYLEILADITRGRPNPLILYDQIGNARSTHLPDKMGDAEFWSVQLFIDELNNLITKLGVEEYDLLGHSWGGMFAAEVAIRQPPGLKHLVIMSSPASMALWSEAQNVFKAQLPEDIRKVLDKFEGDGIDTPEYQAAVQFYYARHLCLIKPLPDSIAHCLEWIEKDPTVYLTMNGPSEFNNTGSLKTWSVIDRLDRITVPTLITNGDQDEAADSVLAPFVEGIPGARWVKFQNASHMAHYEAREEFMRTVGGFLYD